MEIRVELTIKQIAEALGLGVRGLTNKAKRNGWPFIERKVGTGSPTRYYDYLQLPEKEQFEIIRQAGAEVLDILREAVPYLRGAEMNFLIERLKELDKSRGGSLLPSSGLPLPEETRSTKGAPLPLLASEGASLPVLSEGKELVLPVEKVPGRGLIPVRNKALAELKKVEGLQVELKAIEHLPEEKRKEVAFRGQVVNEFLTRSRLEKNADFMERVQVQFGRKISYSQVYRWSTKFNQLGMSGLIDFRGRQNGENQKITGWVKEWIVAAIIHKRGLIKPSLLHRLINAQALTFGEFSVERYRNYIQTGKGGFISQRQVGRFLTQYKTEFKVMLDHISNPDKAKSKYQPAFGTQDADVIRVNQRWQIDSSPLDAISGKLVMLKDGGQRFEEHRFQLVSVIDVYSRMCVIDVVDTSNAYSLGRLLFRAILKIGLPEELRTDNGKDYLSVYFQGVLTALGIKLLPSRPFHGEDKGYVERAFRTIQHSFTEMLDGYAGHNVAERQQIEARISKADRISGRKTGLPDLMAAGLIQQRLDDWLEYQYINSYHRGLESTPRKKYLEGAELVNRVDPITLNFAFSERIENKPYGKEGITYNRKVYIAPELAGYPGEKFDLVLDWNNINRGYCYLHSTGAFVCAVRTGDTEPLTVEERKEVIKNYNRSKKQFKAVVKTVKQFDEDLAKTVTDVAKQVFSGQQPIEEMGRDLEPGEHKQVDKLAEDRKLVEMAEAKQKKRDENCELILETEEVFETSVDKDDELLGYMLGRA